MSEAATRHDAVKVGIGGVGGIALASAAWLAARGHAVHGVRAGEVTRRQLSETDVIEIVRAEVVTRTAVAEEYERIGQTREAARLRSEADSLNTFVDLD